MLDQTNANIERHIKTHTERSDDDRSAVSVLETFLRSNGRINTSFASDDKWPNHDDTFEFVPNPDISRRPKQAFYVQIKGTRNYTEREGAIKYTLKDLAFPAFICGRVSLDPGILFVILNPAERGDERVFWKYMSPSFLNSIDFAKDSITVSFSPEEEILNNEESVLAFCERLEEIVERHSFVNQLERHSYSFEEAKRIVETCDTEITESIDNLSILNKSRDNISRRILTRLNDLCISALLLNAMKDGYQSPNAGFAWEYSLLRANTKYLGNFYRGLQYIGRRIPEEGQAERLMLKYYSTGSTRFGRYTVRYLLLNLREDLLERVMPSQFNPQWKCRDLYLSKKCFPFERNPLASDLADSKTSQLSQAKYLARVVEKEKTEIAVPYWSIVKSMQDTGEIYCNLGGDLTEQAIQKYNDCLDDWERQKGYEIISDGNVACIAAYEASTLFILNKLLELSQLPNKGQKEVNERYLRDCNIAFSDPKKEEALKYAFVNSRVLLIYGAAGTGKTTLIDMISTMLSGRRKLFLTKTHTALQNLQRRINNPGADASFVSINSFTKRVNLPDYDVIFVDECSTIDNRAMKVFLEKMRPDTFLVLAGDTYQIESIDFGNWFTYAKDIIKTKGSNVELVSTWRTKDPGLIELWNETRNKGALITEKLVIDGPFSENIGEGVLNSEIMDEVILCLNYDGKFGLNNMNSYFQNANTETAVVWRDWKYKVGDHILFNDTDRFSLLYNNLKGQIVQIELFDSRIIFTVDVEIPLTEQDCQNDGIEFIDIIDDVTRIRFDVLDFEEEMADEDRKKAIVPFQLAYAVSIHKAQGLEYRSVKVVIPSSNAEKITHGIFYTAITRAKEKLKIYWSSETMQEVVAGFSVDTSRQKSLAIIKEKLKQDKNT